ncbi:MAG: hypothetical protein M1834_006001 [Cirrosporium novae-zelandiae]|nr:MAG: hypothetical protein M1834_006001 [Cirrosporium novae-zelandiae]
MSTSSLDRLVKGAPPPDITISSVLPPKEPLSDSKRSSRGSVVDPLSTLPSSPPQIYLNLLILETSLRSQYLVLRARRRQYTFFLLLLLAWVVYFTYALFLRPREDGRGLGGSVYWVVEMTEKVALMAGVFTAILIWGTGQWERGIRWPRRWLGVTNRGLRTMNAKVVVIKGPWYKELLSHLSFLFPFLSSSDGSAYHYIEPPPISASEKRLSGHHSNRHSTASSGDPEDDLIEEDLAPGGDHIKLLLLPKPFSAEFRENWELYRTEYWEKENERRTHLLRRMKAREKQRAKAQSGWFWRTGRRSSTRSHIKPIGSGGTSSKRSSQNIDRLSLHRHRDRDRDSYREGGMKRHSTASNRTESHSRNSSRSTTPSAVDGGEDGGRPGFGERNRRGSSVSDRRKSRLKLSLRDSRSIKGLEMVLICQNFLQVMKLRASFKRRGHRRYKSPFTAVSCKFCYDLDLNAIPKPHKDPDICSIGQVARYWIKSSALERSVNRGCQTCSVLRNAIDTLIQRGGLVEVPELPASPVKYRIAICDPNEHQSGSQSLRIVLRCALDSQDDEEFEVELFTLLAGPPAPWPAIGIAGEVPTEPGGETCADIIRPWLVDCNENHQVCRSSTPRNQPLPKRVLDVSHSKVVLVETGGKAGQHIALSHCWGKEQLLTTTRATIDERKKGIRWEELPKTFQDAIQITRGLGVPYIWIDSLCIVQQDTLDWEQQSAVMADVYTGSYLNIATTRSSSGAKAVWAAESDGTGDSEGDESKPRIRKCKVKSFKVPSDDESQRMYVRLALESSHEAMLTARWIGLHKETAPLLQRAWVYQERTLSSRTVHLHSNEMVWSCKAKLLCECKILDGSPPGGDGWSASKDEIANLSKLKNNLEIHGLWRKIVEDYTKLDLTYETDRLPALSGLASMFSARFPVSDKYLAGLWKGDLARDLLWEPGGAGVYHGGTRHRHSKPCPPSWSWASLIWGGDFDSDLKYEVEFKLKLVEWDHSVIYRQDPRLSIISVACSTVGENPFGEISGGSIILEGAACSAVATQFCNVPGHNWESGDDEDPNSDDSYFLETSSESGSGPIDENHPESVSNNLSEWEDYSSPQSRNSSPSSLARSHSRSPPLPILLFDPEVPDDYILIEWQALSYDVAPLSSLEGETLHCLFIGSFIRETIPERSTDYKALVLKPSDTDNRNDVLLRTFERIGICTDRPWDKVGSLCSRYAKRMRVEVV